MRLDKRYAKGFQFTASYTLSRLKTLGGDTLGLGEGPTNLNNFRADYGPGALDRNHRLVVSGIWELPYFKKSSNGFKKHVLGGYTLALISTTFSGLPESAFLPDGVDLSGTIGALGGGATYLPGTHGGSIGRDVKSVSQLNALITSYNSNRSSLPGVHTCTDPGPPVRTFPCDPFDGELRALALLPVGTKLGGDSLLSQDIRVTKAFYFGEKRHLDLIAEVFNIFNFANLTGVGNNILPAAADITSPADFKAPGAVYVPSLRQTSVFGTGGPRAFQFAFKFTF